MVVRVANRQVRLERRLDRLGKPVVVRGSRRHGERSPFVTPVPFAHAAHERP
jgi:hypothetical protein